MITLVLGCCVIYRDYLTENCQILYSHKFMLFLEYMSYDICNHLYSNIIKVRNEVRNSN